MHVVAGRVKIVVLSALLKTCKHGRIPTERSHAPEESQFIPCTSDLAPCDHR